MKFGIYFTKIVGRNFCDLMLFCQICENLYPQITWFSNILLINSRNNFLDCKKLFLRTLFFSMKHCLQNFPVYSFRGHFFGHDIIYLTICECLFLQKLTPGTPLARVISLRFANFSASKSLFQESFYLYDTASKLPFWGIVFHWTICWKGSISTLSGTLGFLMLVRTGQLVSLSHSKFGSVGISNLIWRWNILDKKYFQKKLDDVVGNFDDFIIL